MLVVNHKKGDIFLQKGDRVSQINIIIKGSVIMKTKNDKFILETGAVIGINEIADGICSGDYVAKEDLLLATYELNSPGDIDSIFKEEPKYTYAFLHAIMTQSDKILERYKKYQNEVDSLYLFVVEQYKEYNDLCEKYNIDERFSQGVRNINPLEFENSISDLEFEYVADMAKKPTLELKKIYMQNSKKCIEEIVKTSVLIKRAIHNIEVMEEYKEENKKLIYESDGKNLYSLYFDLSKKLAIKGENILEIQKQMRKLQQFLIKKHLYKSKDVLEIFQRYWKFNFAEYKNDFDFVRINEDISIPLEPENPQGMDYLKYILSYAGYDVESQNQLLELAKEYEKASKCKSKSPKEIDICNRMTDEFFEVYKRAVFIALEVGELSPVMKLFFQFGFFIPTLLGREKSEQLFLILDELDKKENMHIYLFYDRLKRIWDNGKYSKDQKKKIITDEIEITFKSSCKEIYGRGGMYFPILNEECMLKSLEDMMVTEEKIKNVIDEIENIDFRCFYQDSIFEDYDGENTQIILQKKVYPDIILMPLIGKQSIYWNGKIVMPIFTNCNIKDILLNSIASYRWETCKKIKGENWNDINDKSLTSEYYEYIQTYKKNKNLSPAMKEKIKISLAHNDGNIKKIFQQDYINWIKYESTGSYRLNKVAREIFSKYCPFSVEYRVMLMENPMFKNAFSKYENSVSEDELKLRKSLKKYKDSGGKINSQMKDTLLLFKM